MSIQGMKQARALAGLAALAMAGLVSAENGRSLSPREIASGVVSNAQAEPLQQALGQASTSSR